VEKVVKHIGELKGQILLFGGVYSNLHALEALHDLAIEHNIPKDNIICTGDIVAYCAYPAQCVDLIEKWGIHVIAGNVELNLLDQADDCGCNFSEGSRCDLLSKQWYPFAKAQIHSQQLGYIRTIPHHIKFDYYGRKLTVIHGTAENVSGFIFKSTPWIEKEAILHSEESDIIIAGHCGLPFVDRQEGKTWLNAGVIGMPANDAQTNTWYAILDFVNDEPQITFHKLFYEHQAAADAMIKESLPLSYAQTLVSGLWDNCDILPEVETAQQGKEIKF
jgi:predicted phosphodiesterase